MSISNQELVSPAAKSGLTLGLIGIIITLLIYFINAKLLANIWVGVAILIISLSLVVYFGITFRKQVGGYLSFKQAFIYSLVLLLVAGLVGQTFNYLLFNVIDSDLTELVTNAALENTEAMMEKFNVPDEEIDKALEKTEAQMANQYKLGGVMKAYMYSIIIYAIISLITGAIIKRKNPEEVI
ncbi:MAG: hypothetical protein DHS20C17_26160 [Cyclobacteriaceae bacterium]|nr:MAG: hypothetical protein DHS20C17_26160 [Cyclobacteriaceae bacterium]